MVLRVIFGGECRAHVGQYAGSVENACWALRRVLDTHLAATRVGHVPLLLQQPRAADAAPSAAAAWPHRLVATHLAEAAATMGTSHRTVPYRVIQPLVG